MWGHVQRHRRKFYIAAAVGAGAASAYYCYSRWASSGGNKVQQRIPSSLIDGESSGACSDPCTTNEDSPLDCHLQQHFDTIQSISVETTLPSMMPQLLEYLYRTANVEDITERLRQSRGSSAVSQAEKNALWQELKIVSFTRTLSACWAIPLLDLLIRCQLNLLGRQMYLNAVVNGKRSVSVERLNVLPISSRCQEIFLAQADFLCQCGLEALMTFMRQAVVKVVGRIGLKEQVDVPQLLQYMSDIHAEFENEVSSIGYSAFLLPTQQQLQAAMMSVPDPTVLAQPTTQLVDEEVVEQLVSQLRDTMATQAFDSAVRGAVQSPVKVMRDGLAAAVGSERLLLAKLLPIVAGATQHIVDQRPHITVSIARVPEVDGLCAMVYSGDRGS